MPDNQSMEAVIEDFKKGGWIMAILGGLGMLARLILTNEEYRVAVWTRKVIAGGIVGVISYFALYGVSIDPMYKSVLCSISGSIAPELFEYVRRKFIQKAK